VAGCCECGDEPSGSCAMELVSYVKHEELAEAFGTYAHKILHRILQ
jgi:hypothetical protein